MEWNISLVSCGRLPGCIPFQPVTHHASSLGGQSKKWCSATAKILVCYQHCFGHASKTQHHNSWYEET